jgi:ribonuclease P protein component
MPHSLNIPADNSFPKEERLHSKKLIQELFDKGSSFYLYPFKIIILPNSADPAAKHQLLISVSKRKFKLAVDRNVIKRKINEAYRLNKQLMYSNENIKEPLLIAYIYSGKESHPFQFIQNKLIKSIKRLNEEVLKLKS